MTCPACGHANRDAARFCGACAAPLVQECSCVHCGTANPPGQKFCDACGQPLAERARAGSLRAYTPRHLADRILTSRSALEGERKQVTVLFADVKGSMELAEQVDPERWHRILDGLFHVLSDGVHRFEGTVNQYTGDGIMALFGAPIAHEDHAQRACWAALHLQGELERWTTEVKREHGLAFSVRMGLNSGEVVVGRIGDDLRMDYTAQGHTVGLAQRMEALADPGTCYLTAHTAALVGGWVELKDLGEFRLRGAAAPVHVHQLVGPGSARTRFDVARARGLTRFVGRVSDMRALDDALELARAGNGQVVGVVADAGTGKSRLCFEFAERRRAEGVEVWEGHAVAHGKNVPLLPILQIFRTFFGIGDRDAPRTVREKIAGRMLLLDPAFGDALPLLFDFLGAPDPERSLPRVDGEVRQRQLFGLLRRVSRVAPGNDVAVTLIEDLHWLDPASETLVAQMVENVAGTRNLLLVNFRPEYHAPWMARSYYRQLPLAPLGPEALRELLGDVLGNDPSLEGLAETIHERTRGNPFYTEEVVRRLVEDGTLVGTKGGYRLTRPVGRLAIPATVESVLAARIDRLAEREKEVLQAAAVIGKEFTEPMLAAVDALPAAELAEAIATLKGAELVYEKALYPVAEYAFSHPLAQEVAYRSQLSERRARTHAAVARAMEAGEHLDELAGLISHHHEAGGQLLEAARWAERASAWAVRTDVPESRRQAERVIALLEPAEPSAERDRLELAALAQLVRVAWRLERDVEGAEGIRPRLARVRVLAGRLGDEATLAAVLANLALNFVNWRGADAYAHLDEAIRLADRTGDPALRVGVRAPLAVLWVTGRLEEGLRRADEIIALTNDDRELGTDVCQFNPRDWARAYRAVMLCALGRGTEGERELEGARSLVRESGDTLLIAAVEDWATNALLMLGHPERALAAGRQALELLDRIGIAAWPPMYGNLVRCLRETGSPDEAARMGEDYVRDAGSGPYRTSLVVEVAAAQLSRGDRDRALELVRLEAEAPAEDGLVSSAGTHVLAASVLREAGEPAARVEAALARAEKAMAAVGAAVYEPQLLEERARIAAREGDEARAAELLVRARARYVEVGATGHARRLARDIAPPGTP